jgi:hypothetical protein
MIIGHLAKFILAGFKALSQIIAKGQDLNKIFQQQLKENLLLPATIAILALDPLKDAGALNQKGNNTQNIIILPILNKLDLGEFEVILLLVLVGRGQQGMLVGRLELLG